MSRVTHSTFRSAAAATLLAAALGLSACGSDDNSSGDNAAAPTPTAVASTTPAATSPTPKPKKGRPVPKVMHSPVTVTAVGRNAIDAASTKTLPAATMQKQLDSIVGALEKEGYKPKNSAVQEGQVAVIQVPDSTVITLYPDENYAAKQLAGFTIMLNRTAKTKARLARYGNAMVATTVLTGLTPAAMKEFNAVRKVVEKHVES